jgi:hypothetical protein
MMDVTIQRILEFNRRQQQQRNVAGDNDEFDNNRRENE